MKRLIIYTICVLLAGNALAQSLTLEACKQMARENNRNLKSKAMEQRMAKETTSETFTNYFPVISASGTYFKATRGLIEMPTETPDGTPVSMEVLKHGKTASLTLMQPVFAGGQIVNGNKLARISREVADLQYAIEADDVELTTEQYFWQIVQLKEKLKTIEVVEQQLAEIRKDVELSIKAGLTTHNDLLRVELQENETASNRLTIENAIAISKMLLQQYIGALGDSIDVDSGNFSTPSSPLQYYVDPFVAVQGRNEKALLDRNVEASRLQTRIETGKRLPSLSIGASYSYDDFLDSNNTSGMVFATVSVPISEWWGGSHSIRKQRMKTAQAANDRQNAIEQLAVQTTQAWNELQEAYKQIDLARSSIASAEENMRMNRDFYRAGTITLTDLFAAQTLLQQSRDRLTEACANYQVKLTEYRIYTK